MVALTANAMKGDREKVRPRSLTCPTDSDRRRWTGSDLAGAIKGGREEACQRPHTQNARSVP